VNLHDFIEYSEVASLIKEKIENGNFELDVKLPDKQKKLIQLGNESTEEDNAIIRLFHVRKAK
jgi:hypothetical protein